jgi:hypothetical protein
MYQRYTLAALVDLPQRGIAMIALGFFGPGPQPSSRPVQGRLRRPRKRRWRIATALSFAMISGLVIAAITADDKCKSQNSRCGQFAWKQAHWLGDAECRQPQSDALYGVP